LFTRLRDDKGYMYATKARPYLHTGQTGDCARCQYHRLFPLLPWTTHLGSLFPWPSLCSSPWPMSASSRLPLPFGIPATDTETEQEILGAVEAATGGKERSETLWRLVLFYQEQAKRSDLAVALLELMIQESSDDTESTAIIYFVLGRIAQADEKWTLALEHYENGLCLLPKQRETAYFLRNNAGYCLNAQGLYSAGERYCRWAIEIDYKRPDAFKNLGISLYGQGDLKGAAWLWVQAIKVDPSNPEARNLLKRLLTNHPALKSECAWIQQELKDFRKIIQS